jgi:hypothetical protein
VLVPANAVGSTPAADAMVLIEVTVLPDGPREAATSVSELAAPSFSG